MRLSLPARSNSFISFYPRLHIQLTLRSRVSLIVDCGAAGDDAAVAAGAAGAAGAVAGMRCSRMAFDSTQPRALVRAALRSRSRSIRVERSRVAKRWLTVQAIIRIDGLRFEGGRDPRSGSQVFSATSRELCEACLS